jgi:hypothetical protein
MYAGVLPWETEGEGDTPLKALAVTFINSFSKHDRFFSAAAHSKPLIPALIYGLLMGSIGTLATVLWEHLSPFSISSMLSGTASLAEYAHSSVSPAALIATPLILLCQFFFMTLYSHVMLVLTRSSNVPFRSTFKIICYVQGASLLQLIPFVGVFFSFLAGLYLLVAGVHVGHSISKTRAFLVLVLPLALFILLLAAITLFVLAGIVLSKGPEIDPFSLLRR